MFLNFAIWALINFMVPFEIRTTMRTTVIFRWGRSESE
jgi:hypothetical protein